MTARGRFRHYKGHFYEVLGEAKHSETTEVLGTAYLRIDADEPVVWIRPDEMFGQTVDFEGKTQPRFEHISDGTWRTDLDELVGVRKALGMGVMGVEPGAAPSLVAGVLGELATLRKRVAELEKQLHEPGYVDALRGACEGVAELVPMEFRNQRDNVDLDQLEALPELVGRYIGTLTAWTEEDKDLPEDRDIIAAHPTETGKHDLYLQALRLVEAKRSKYALVDLVNWLLSRVP
jgi:hypothetical protein